MPHHLEEWPQRLQHVIDHQCRLLQRAVVVRETDSTQDAARRMNCSAGDVVTAWRQTAGRGRLGRTWADTAENGIAFTIITARDVQRPQRLAIASAIGVAIGTETRLGQQVKIKWPNDIVVNGRKLAGILIEQFDSLALIGIGLNVSQMEWPANLVHRATSLAQLGCLHDRLDVLAAVLPALDHALQLSEVELQKEFSARDALCGQTLAFCCGDRIVVGTVLGIDPMNGLVIQTIDGEMWLDAATTSLLPRAADC